VTTTEDGSRGDRVRQAIVSFIVTFYAEHHFPPTVREVGEAVGLSSSSTTQEHLRILIDEGRITRTPGTARSIVVVQT
jgi:repressor LexA